MKILSVLIQVCCILFAAFLSLVQPEYNHLVHTTSYLVYGRFGLLQQINFILLSLSIGLLGYGLGFSLFKKRANTDFVSSIVVSVIVLLLIVYPTDQNTVGVWSEMDAVSRTGFIHYILTICTFFFSGLIILFAIPAVKKHSFWKSSYAYTSVVLIVNGLLGAAWFILVGFDLITEWMGLYQKVLILNTVVWIGVMGRRLGTLTS